MIGVIARKWQKSSVEEFFQLFKIPWEYYDREKSYDTVVVSDPNAPVPTAKLVIIYSPGISSFDNERNVRCNDEKGNALLEYGTFQFPVYKNFSTFQSENKSIISIIGKTGSVGFQTVYHKQKIIRIGYDLFDEIAFIISRGQPVEYAHIPTLEIHISILRSLIVDSGLPLLEVLPIPAGFKFIVCLTHDVDFLSIRSHKFDRSVIGFIYRAIFPLYSCDQRPRNIISNMLKNWVALLSLPGVHLGLFPDFWFDLDRYSEIEKEMGATVFFIPFKDKPGDGVHNNPPEYRAARYDVNDYKEVIQRLIKNGYEIALHGIDAWHDCNKGNNELDAIRRITDDNEIGVRMHWLYFSDRSGEVLEHAGFLYDSTIGYNETIGFKPGTAQVYVLPGSSKVFELPLIIMDMAMFSRGRMRLSERKAMQMCRQIINDMKTYGGVLTINWHTRSLSPERNWDAFYMELLEMLKSEKVWFTPAKQAINWFKKRRSIRFDEIEFLQNKIWLKVSGQDDKRSPDLLFRIYNSGAGSFKNGESVKYSSDRVMSFIDIPWSGKTEIELTLYKDLAQLI